MERWLEEIFGKLNALIHNDAKKIQRHFKKAEIEIRVYGHHEDFHRV